MKPTVLSAPAIEWLAVWPEVRGLALDGGVPLASLLTQAGHSLFAISDRLERVAALASQPEVVAICARPEGLPIDPFQFDVVFSHNGFHRMDPTQALSEIARVLRPGGCFSASYVVRDDSVPWVRRLAALLRHFDPMAMKGDYGQESLQAVAECRYFPEVEQRAFRVWQPVSLGELQKLVANQPLMRHLNQSQQQALADQVRELFEASVRPGEQLRLPYQLVCWRAWVDHDELTAAVARPDQGIRINV